MTEVYIPPDCQPCPIIKVLTQNVGRLIAEAAELTDIATDDQLPDKYKVSAIGNLELPPDVTDSLSSRATHLIRISAAARLDAIDTRKDKTAQRRDDMTRFCQGVLRLCSITPAGQQVVATVCGSEERPKFGVVEPVYVERT